MGADTAASSGMLHNPLFAPPAFHGECRRPDALTGSDGTGSQSAAILVSPDNARFVPVVSTAIQALIYESIDVTKGSPATSGEDQAYALPPGAEDAAGYVIPDSNQPATYAASRQDSAENRYDTVDAVQVTSIVPDHRAQDQVGIGAMAAQRLAELQQMQRAVKGIHPEARPSTVDIL